MNGKSSQVDPVSELDMVKASTDILIKITYESATETFPSTE
jgi:hypothetical protein